MFHTETRPLLYSHVYVVGDVTTEIKQLQSQLEVAIATELKIQKQYIRIVVNTEIVYGSNR